MQFLENLPLKFTSDTQSPEIYQCPTYIETYAGRKNDPVVVNWKEPEAKDNSNDVKLIQKQGPRPGSSFKVGIKTIRYQAEDGSGNLSPPCVFLVIVQGRYQSCEFTEILAHDTMIVLIINETNCH